MNEFQALHLSFSLTGVPREDVQQYDYHGDNLGVFRETNVDVNEVPTWFPCDDRVAFYRASDHPLTYAELHEQVRSSPWQDDDDADDVRGREAVRPHVIVAVLLRPSQMAEMAVVLISLLSRPHICVAPLDPNMPRPKLLDALYQLGCTALVSTKDLLEEYAMYDMMNADCQDFLEEDHDHSLPNLRTVYVVTPCPSKGAGAVDWNLIYQNKNVQTIDNGTNAPKTSPALLLRTSGTTAKPKIVPITREALLYNATCLAASLQLQRNDVGCNAMPFFHIGGILCALLTVLVSGSAVIMEGFFDPNTFLDRLLADSNDAHQTATDGDDDDGGYSQRVPPSPSWYYGVPTMHKSILLAGTARLRRLQQEDKASKENLSTKLRFIRSGADHLPHPTAVQLSKLFHVPVLSTYSMSECMPVCSSTFDDAIVWDKPTKFIDSVGFPIGCSLRVVNDQGMALGYEDGVGEVVIRGPGVLQSYPGIPQSITHTTDGWLKTGDMGVLDRHGHLVLKGRLKHMIKRGGEQVWPDEVDDIVKEIPGVAMAMTFGVKNELWGEEVAVAVVLTDKGVSRGEQAMEQDIIKTCRESLDTAAVPCQIVFLESTDRLLRTATGKYVRTGLADHLGVRSQDTRALSAMMAATAPTTHRKVEPSTALNGLRLLVACFVVQGHIGLYPNTAWLRIQNFSMNMQIFFFLGAFQLVCSVGEGVLDSWAQFVGTKIGSMHAVFVVSQVIALPSYLLFQCGAGGYQETFNDMSCVEVGKWWRTIIGWVINTACGIFDNEVNSASWFLAAFYMLIVIFPWMDSRLRRMVPVKQFIILVVTMLLSVFTFHYLYFKAGLWILTFKVVAWLPSFVAAMIAGYFFLQFAPDSVQVCVEQEHETDGNSRHLSSLLPLTKPAIVTDLLSLVCLILTITVAAGANCVWMPLDQFQEMRPGEPIPVETFLEIHHDWNETYVLGCNITMEEFEDYVHLQSDSSVLGRWSTNLDRYAGFIVLHFPLTWLWLYGLAHGQGLTAYAMNNPLLQKLGYLAYPLFLLHMPISRFYWVATRGHHAEKWWYVGKSGLFYWLFSFDFSKH